MPLITEKPVLTLIADELFRRLETLVIEPNDAFRFKGPVRPTRIADYAPEHSLIVLTRGEVARINELDCPGNPPSLAYQQTFLVRVHIAPSERDKTPVERYEDVAEAELIKAICGPPMWYKMGGNAIDTELGPVQTSVSEGGYDGIALPVIVTYRVSEGNPYEVRS